MKKRIDILVVENNICETREKAKRNIMAGNILVDNMVVDKPGTLINEEAVIVLKNEAMRFVSRGGFKLEKAIIDFGIELSGRTCLDIGASTGGFTDCMLQNGAKKVYSIDVGYGQLDWKLRNDPRVICMERTNVRYLDTDIFKDDEVTFSSVDVSFISLKLILPVVKKSLSSNQFDVVVLIKPQFEAGREEVKKHGVVKDKSVHYRVISEIVQFASELDLNLENLSFSPITGPKGNIEFLAHFKLKSDFNETADISSIINEVVENAHSLLLI